MKNLKNILIGLIAGVLITSTFTFVFADEVIETLTAYRNQYPVYADNEEAKDIDIIKAGDFNYIKLADVSKLFNNVEVSFNETKQRIEVKTMPNTVINNTDNTTTNEPIQTSEPVRIENENKKSQLDWDYSIDGIKITVIDGKEYCNAFDLQGGIQKYGGWVYGYSSTEPINIQNVVTKEFLVDIPHIKKDGSNFRFIEYEYVLNTIIPFIKERE